MNIKALKTNPINIVIAYDFKFTHPHPRPPKFNLNNFSNHQNPFSHSIFENVLNIKFEVILNELMKIQDEDFVFSKNSNFQKKELRACSGIFGEMMNELNSETFLFNI